MNETEKKTHTHADTNKLIRMLCILKISSASALASEHKTFAFLCQPTVKHLNVSNKRHIITYDRVDRIYTWGYGWAGVVLCFFFVVVFCAMVFNLWFSGAHFRLQ